MPHAKAFGNDVPSALLEYLDRLFLVSWTPKERFYTDIKQVSIVKITVAL